MECVFFREKYRFFVYINVIKGYWFIYVIVCFRVMEVVYDR